MSRFNTLFVSSVPSTIQAFRSFFQNDDTIKLSQKCYTDIIDNPQLISEKYKVIVLDDGASTPKEQTEIKKYLCCRLRQKIILLTSSLDKIYLNFLVYNGIAGIISKRAEMNVIKEGIISVCRGKQFLCNIIKGIVFNPDTFINIPKLSKREKEIICGMLAGKNNKEIAEELFISTKEVETIKYRMIKKLQLNGTRELIIFALRNILTSLLPLIILLGDTLE